MESKPTPQKLYSGLAGSPLARVNKTVRGQKGPNWTALAADKDKLDKFLDAPSDRCLRETPSDDRQKPVYLPGFTDENGVPVRGGGDLDNSFQPYSHDPRLRGRRPNADSDAPRSGGAIDPEKENLAGIFGVDSIGRKGPKGYQCGRIPGGRHKRRRAVAGNWWVFVEAHLREFLAELRKQDERDANRAEFVLYRFYFLNQEDEDIFADIEDQQEQPTAKTIKGFKNRIALKNYRQRLLKRGLEQFGPRPAKHFREFGRYPETRGVGCGDPECQCSKNDKSDDFTGRNS